MNKNQYAPIALFVYNRPDFTEKTLQAIGKNLLASQSRLFIFSDAPKNEKDIQNVKKVRKIIRKYASSFLKTEIIEQKENKGLANSIVQGVSQLLNVYDKIIVLEDDLLSTPYFLKYLNKALGLYENSPQVCSVAGFSPIRINAPNYPYDVYACYRSSSWGWATWKRVWQKTDWSKNKLKNWLNDPQLLKEASLKMGEDIPGSLLNQFLGKIDSWAIIFAMHIFSQKGLTIYPTQNMIKHIGYGNSVHHRKAKYVEHPIYPDFQPLAFPEEPSVNEIFMKKYVEMYKQPLLRKTKYKVFFSMYRYFPRLLHLVVPPKYKGITLQPQKHTYS